MSPHSVTPERSTADHRGRARVVAQAAHHAAMARHAAYVRAKDAAIRSGDSSLAAFCSSAAQRSAERAAQASRTMTDILRQQVAGSAEGIR